MVPVLVSLDPKAWYHGVQESNTGSVCVARAQDRWDGRWPWRAGARLALGWHWPKWWNMRRLVFWCELSLLRGLGLCREAWWVYWLQKSTRYIAVWDEMGFDAEGL